MEKIYSDWECIVRDYWWFVPLILAALIFLYEVNRVHGVHAMLLLLAGIFLAVTFIGWVCSDNF